MIISVYRDEDCTDLLGSGIVGEYRALIYAGVNAWDSSSTFTLDGKTYPVRQIWDYNQSTVDPDSEPTKIQMDDIHDSDYHYLYLTPNLRIRYKMNRNSIHNYYLYWHSWQWKSPTTNEWVNLSAWRESPISQMYSPPEISFRTAKTAQNASQVYENYLCIDVTYKDQTGQSTINERASFGFSTFDVLYGVGYTAGKYKPKTGNTSRRAGTGTGYYPNGKVPNMPVTAINNLFDSVLGRGNGLTYYKLVGDGLEKITDFIYDGLVTIANRTVVFRDAICSVVAIPFSITADVTNTKNRIYIASRGVDPNSQCDFITRPIKIISFGTINLTPSDWGYKNFADIKNTSATLYLPCYGAVNIDMASIANGILTLEGVLDCRNGNLLYRLLTQASEDDVPTLYGQYSGNCGIPIPIGGSNSQVSILGVASGVAQVAHGAVSFSAGHVAQSVLRYGNGILGGTKTAANELVPTIDKSGVMQPSVSAYGTPVPVLQIQKHIMLMPPNWAHLHGYISAGLDKDEAYKLSDFSSGLFVAEDVRCDDLNLTRGEQEELIRLLKEGVYL